MHFSNHKLCPFNKNLFFSFLIKLLICARYLSNLSVSFSVAFHGKNKTEIQSKYTVCIMWMDRFCACAMSTPVWVLVWECVYVTGLLAVGPEWDPELLFARMHRTCFCVTNIQKVECERAREIERSQRKREI